MVVTTDHVGDAHIEVVNDHAEIIGWGAIRALNDEVIQLAVLELQVALNHVVKGDHALIWIAEAHDIRLIGAVLAVVIAAVTVIAWL